MRVVSYLRVSSQTQIDNTSIDVQEEKIELYCKLHNIEIVKKFKDEGISGKNSDRKEYSDMINFISNKDNKINAIIVYKADRIHRSLKNLMIMIEHLQDLEINFISITEQFDTSSAQGLLFLQMLGSFSEFERKIIAERTRSGRIKIANNAEHAGGKIPFGYRLENKMLTLHKEESEIIKDIFKMRTKGQPLQVIGNKYNMSKQRIAYIISNKTYLGKFDYDGKKEKNKISFKVPHIISKYTWDKANSVNKRDIHYKKD